MKENVTKNPTMTKINEILIFSVNCDKSCVWNGSSMSTSSAKLGELPRGHTDGSISLVA